MLTRLLALAFCLVVALPAGAQQTSDDSTGPSAPAPDDPPAQAGAQTGSDVDELRRRIDVLAAEVEKLRSGETPQRELTDEQRRALGLAPSAAATYRRAGEGVSFAGYGETLLENFASENESGRGNAPTTRLDFLRAVVYAGYRFSDRFLFNSELEFEHGGDEVSVEFAYLDYMINKNLTLRGGMMLLPLGLVNEFHEPTVFIGTRRPETERRILPSTWHENGAGLVGSFGHVNFRAYVVNGFNATGFAAAGVRGGRQGGAEANAEDVAFAGRLDVTPVAGAFAGIGVYRGGSGQGEIEAGGRALDVGTTIVELHGQAQIRGFDLRALFAHADIDDAAGLNAALKTKTTSPVAEEMRGGYGQVGYNVLSQLPTSLSLMPYLRLEHVDTQHRVPAGFTRDLSRVGTIKTFGVELKPIPNIVIKTDYQWMTNDANSGRNQFNVNLGYAF